MTDLRAYSDAQLAAIAGEIDPDTDALVRTVWGEARNQAPEGRKAVASVIRNRARMSGQPISAVVRESGQFEPWGDPATRPQLEGLDPSSNAYLSILGDIEGDDDPTGGATHFYSPQAQAAKGRKPPSWDNGTGSDIGDHRFFKLAYGGQPEQAPPALEEMSDQELEAIAADEPQAQPSGEIGDVEFISTPNTAMGARKSSIVDAEEGKAATPAQEAFYVGEIKAGRLDPEKVRGGAYRPGSEEFPLLQRDADDLPKPGDWYVSPSGEKRQVAEVPWTDTLGSVARLAINPGGAATGAVPLDPRTAAAMRAMQSGVMLGGRNELVAGIQSLPSVLEGGVPLLTERFGDVLEREDRASGQARRDFPMVYDGAAVTGALATGAALPNTLLPRLATGAGSGFLATDGDVSRRAVGAGLGVVGGEALRIAAPRVAGAVMDMAGVPMRAAAKGAPEQFSPLTGFPMAPEGVGRPEIRAAEAVRRALDRDATSPPLLEMGPEGNLPFQTGGDNLTGLAEVLAQSPGRGQDIIRQAVRDQQAGASGRVKGEIANTLGGSGDYFERLDGLKASRRDEATKGMERLGEHLVTLDNDSVMALRSDLARGAIREQALNSLASPKPEVRDAGARLNSLYDGLLDKPSAQTLTVRDAQNISRSLLDAANDAYAGGNGSRGAALKDLGKALRANAATPERGGFAEYGDWLKKYGEDSDAIDALELGRQVFGAKLEMSAERLRTTFAGWSDAAKENYRLGVGEAVLDAVRRKGGVTEARQLLKNEEFADRIRVAVPDDMSFQGFMEAMEREVMRADRNNRVVGGSPTYGRQAARADLDAQGRDPLDVAAEAIDTGLSPVKLTGKALTAALKSVTRKDRSLIADPEANAALAKALTDQNEMTRLLNMLERYRAAREIPQLRNQGGAAGYGASAATGVLVPQN
jgi:hypothetical protein